MIPDIRDCYERGQPVLVGTTSIENSELLSRSAEEGRSAARSAERQAARARSRDRRRRPAVRHDHHRHQHGRPRHRHRARRQRREAGVSSSKPTNRWPEDEKQRRIQKLHDEWQALHEQVKAAGGLHIIGTERHESRRIDNQLRGRSGRQGDPGSSRFYLSLDDPLMRIFAGDRVRAIMDRLKMPEGEAIEAGIVTRSIEAAQRKVEARNFDIRKQLLEYDDVVERPAQGDLPAAQRIARSDRHRRDRSRRCAQA